MQATTSIFVALAFNLLTLTGSAPFAQTSDPSDTQTGDSTKSLQTTMDELILKAQTDGPVRVIVGVKVGFRPEGERSAVEVQTQRIAIKQAQADVLRSLASSKVGNVRQFDYVPYLAMEVDAAALAKLKTHPAVSSIQEDVPEPPTLAESVPLTNADDAWLTGFTGATYFGVGKRQEIAILDTGVQGAHEFLTGKVVSEACYSTTSAASNATTVCPNGLGSQTGTGAGVNCNLSITGCDHGTHVAGIAAGANAARGRYGVARGAKIIAIQVSSRFVDGSGQMTCANAGLASPCVQSFVSDQIAGLNRVFALRNTFNIAAVNMSLGGGQFTSNCDTDARKASIDNLRAAGIATVISSGNSGHTNALGAPACISTSISVGSTDDGSLGTTADRVSNFSNSASFLSLLAPGRSINSSVPGVGAYADFEGTSMAAPHVAGAWAILKSAAQAATVSEVLSALVATGVPVRDTRNNITKPRIRVNEAIAMLLPLHPRMMADVNADGRADIVGFNNTGAFVSLSTLGPFTAPQQWEGNFGYLTGGWRAGAYPRMMTDVTGDRRADIIGFGDAGVYVARSTGASFTVLQRWNNFYGYSVFSGRWRVERHPRMLADVNADGRADVVGFGNLGVDVSLSTGTSFAAPVQWVADYGYSQGWRVDQHPRIMADVNGDRRADIVAFGSAGVYVSLSTGASFTAPQLWVNFYGQSSLAGGWRVERHPRMMADVDGDRRADIVGFGNAGVYVAFSTGTSFMAPQLLVKAFGYNAGAWRVEQHPRVMADVNGDGRADIIGFGNLGVGGAFSTGTGFTTPQDWITPGFGSMSQGFQVGRHPRLVADVNADGRADIIGFGNLYVAGSLSTGTGFTAPGVWVNNYSYFQGWR